MRAYPRLFDAFFDAVGQSKTQTDLASVDKNVVSKSQINTNPRGKESIPTKTKEDATLKPAFQNGFLNLKREENRFKSLGLSNCKNEIIITYMPNNSNLLSGFYKML